MECPKELDMGTILILNVRIPITNNSPTESSLNNVELLNEMLEHLATDLRLTVLQTVSHQFTPFGVTIAKLLSESHVTIHTWPELGSCAIDIYTCRSDLNVCRAISIVQEHLPVIQYSHSIKRRTFD